MTVPYESMNRKKSPCVSDCHARSLRLCKSVLLFFCILRAKLQLVADPLTLCTFFPHKFRVEVPFHRQTTYFYQLNHHRQAGQRAFVLDIRKIPTVTMYHVSQRTAGKLFCFSCCLDIRSERFKAGTVLDFCHSASPIYIL